MKNIEELIEELQEAENKNLIAYFNVVNNSYNEHCLISTNDYVNCSYIAIHFNSNIDHQTIVKLGNYIEKNYDIQKISTSQNKMVMWVDLI